MWIPGWILLSLPRELPSHTLLQSGRADSFKMVQGDSFTALRPCPPTSHLLELRRQMSGSIFLSSYLLQFQAWPWQGSVSTRVNHFPSLLLVTLNDACVTVCSATSVISNFLQPYGQ